MNGTDTPASRRLSLVIPAYNEAATIARAVGEADAALASLFDRYEILVVDDGSTDDTARVVGRLYEDYPAVRLIRLGGNRGYGAALRAGFEAAAFDLVAFTDADCQFDLADLGRLVPLAADYPVVVGYRADRKDPWRRRFLSRGYNRLARLLLGTQVRDVDCALKVFRREALADLLPKARGFFVNTEMLTRARQLGYEVVERPVTHRPRLSGESKVSLLEVPKTLRVLLDFWWREAVAARIYGRPAVRRSAVVIGARISLAGSAPQPAAGRLPATAPALPAGPLERRRESV